MRAQDIWAPERRNPNMDRNLKRKTEYERKLSAYIHPRKLTDRVLDRLGGSITREITAVRVESVKNKTTGKPEDTPVLVFGDEYETYPSQEHRHQLRDAYGDDFNTLIGKTVTILKNGHGGTGRTLTCHDSLTSSHPRSQATQGELMGEEPPF